MATRRRIQRPVRPRRSEAVEATEPTGRRDAEVESAQAEAEAVLARIEALLDAWPAGRTRSGAGPLGTTGRGRRRHEDRR